MLVRKTWEPDSLLVLSMFVVLTLRLARYLFPIARWTYIIFFLGGGIPNSTPLLPRPPPVIRSPSPRLLSHPLRHAQVEDQAIWAILPSPLRGASRQLHTPVLPSISLPPTEQAPLCIRLPAWEPARPHRAAGRQRLHHPVGAPLVHPAREVERDDAAAHLGGNGGGGGVGGGGGGGRQEISL
ncbi:hypothetical protein KC338_g281 [Hortaea werneckii]|nr:hypothetical protein KC338_g281 [Hortaea werneckii]